MEHDLREKKSVLIRLISKIRVLFCIQYADTGWKHRATLDLKIFIHMLHNLRPQIFHRQPLRIFARIITKTYRNRLAIKGFGEFIFRPKKDIGGADDVVVFEFDSIEAVGFGNHFFVDFFARTHTYYLLLALWSDGGGYVGDAVGGDFGDEYFAAPSVFEGVHDELDAIVKRDIKTGHFGIRDGQNARAALVQKEGHD